jgi:N-acetyl-D-muramate 6-phosphate phosphatase
MQPEPAFDHGRVRALLFDIDGTLADTDDEYIRRAGAVIRRLHFLFPQRDPTRFLRWSLMVAETPLNLLMGVPDSLGIDAHLARAVEWWALRRPPASDTHFVLMDGMQALLPRLAARYRLAIVTARSARAAQAFLDQFDLAGCFPAVASALTAPHTKPYPDPVLWAARALDVPVEACVMIGDTTVDILAGRRAGAQTIGVLCGFGERAELQRAGANLILENTADLGGILEV